MNTRECVCGHAADWHSHGGAGDCEHDGECKCPTFRDASDPDCEVCGNPADVVCDACADDERERDIARAEELAEEDRVLYGI